MFTRQTFFLVLAAVCLGNISSSATRLLTAFPQTQLQSSAIAGVPLNPGEKGEPDSTMSGTTRSGLYIDMQLLS